MFQKNGCGSNDFDKELNQHKNRTTVPAAFKDVKYADMIRMKEPKKWDHHNDDRGTLETTLIDGPREPPTGGISIDELGFVVLYIL